MSVFEAIKSIDWLSRFRDEPAKFAWQPRPNVWIRGYNSALVQIARYEPLSKIVYFHYQPSTRYTASGAVYRSLRRKAFSSTISAAALAGITMWALNGNSKSLQAKVSLADLHADNHSMPINLSSPPTKTIMAVEVVSSVTPVITADAETHSRSLEMIGTAKAAAAAPEPKVKRATNLYFAEGSASVQKIPDALLGIVDLANHGRCNQVRIHGYAGATGTPEQNERISQLRAKVVESMLKHIIDTPDLVVASGKGVDTQQASGKSCRRVEVACLTNG